jgi:PAS domain S-box-containing protein
MTVSRPRRVPEATPAPDRAREIVDGLGEGFLSVDADWRLTDCNAAAERLLRRRRKDLLGRKLWRLAGVPRKSAFAALGRRVAATRAPEEAELAFETDDGPRILAVRAFPLGGGVGAVWRDITRVRTAERRLAASQACYREVADGVPAAAWMSGRDGGLEFVNPAMAEALGRPEAELLGDGWIAALDPADRAGLLLARAEARSAHAPFHYEARFRAVDGGLRLIQLYGRPRFDTAGAFCGFVGTASDVTEVRAAETRQRTLINELNHRVKNALSTVQSLVRQTLREHKVPRSVEKAVAERLVALAAAHDVLTRENWSGAELSDIAAEAIRPYAGRITAVGPRVRIAPRTAIALSMAFHELATNAAKYGALSTGDGAVELSWTKAAGAVVVCWREHDGPAVSPPKRRGFGSRLLGPVLAGEIGEPASLCYEPEGLVCTISAAVEGP